MKKHNLYFLLTVLLAGLFASCSQEDMDGPQTNEPTSVTLSANVDGGIHTRADGKVTIPYFAFKLRYILEVWTTGANPELIYREEKTNSTGEGEDFTFTLVDNGDYKALLWADFVKGSGETTVTYSGGSYTHYEDQYYTTIPDLKTVTISNLALDGERTSFGTITPRTSLDAFYACHTISKKDGAYAEPVVLTRPFGQINISEKDADALANVYRVKFAYNVPAGFNVESGEPTQTTVQTKTIQELNAQLGTGDFTANLYYDYVFTPATGQTTLGEMTVTFAQEPGSNIVIADYVIPSNMPVVRNKRTNISGHIVSVSDKPSPAAKLSVTVSDGWSDGTIEKDVDLGDYYYDDETYSTTFDNTKTCIGIVYEVNADGKSGKIVGLTQTGMQDSKKWSEENVETGATNTTDGRANMATIAALIANSNGSKSWDNYPAFKWVTEQNNNTGNWDATNDKWYLPAKDEFSALYTAYDTYGKDDFNTKLTTAGGIKFNNYYYLSSTESSSNYSWYTSFSGSGTGVSEKINNYVVRCIRVFECHKAD